MKEGDTLFVALSWSEHPAPTTYEDAYDRLVWTAHHWQHWLDHGEFPDHPWRTYLQRSALTLKGLSYAPTGALVAAATTSLPETPGGERNWDYRYTWIRDATFMLWGLYTLGFDWEANDFFYFMADVAESEESQLQIMYGIGGEHELPEQTLDHLSGYEGATPGAHRQRRPRPGPARRVGRDPRLVLPPHQVARPPARADLADPHQAGRGRTGQLARSRPRHLGGARGAQALHLLQAHVLGGGRPRRAPGRGAGGAGAGRPRGRRRPTRSRTTSARTPWTTGACSASTTTPTRSTPRCCSCRWCASWTPRTSGSRRPSWPSPTSSPTTAWSCATASRRPTTGSPARRARSPSARSGWCRRSWRSASSSAAATCASGCCPTPTRCSCTRRRSTLARAATWATSRRPSPTWR